MPENLNSIFNIEVSGQGNQPMLFANGIGCGKSGLSKHKKEKDT